MPGQPYHLNCVFLLSPLRPETRPPEDMEKLYSPSSERLMVMGRRLEMSNRRPCGWTESSLVFIVNSVA